MFTQNPVSLLNRLIEEPSETPWLEFKQNNDDPDLIGKLISACANAAILAGKTRAYLVYGIEDRTHKKVGTDVDFSKMKKGNENFKNWISRMIEPSLMMEFLDFEDENKKFAILVIEPTYDRPVKFSGTEYIRVGENTKKLMDFPEYERSIWYATGRKKFESAIALSHQSIDSILHLLDFEAYYDLTGEDVPKNSQEIVRKFIQKNLIIEDMEGGFDITNLGAILLARDIENFPSIASKSVRVVKYVGRDKMSSSDEQEGKRGYASGFRGLLKYILGLVPAEEKYIDGVRRMVPIFPEVAIREIIANALIHQDFMISGAGPMIEIYSDRIEVINPGNSLIDIDRILDERKSRNEKLASTMRDLNLCEERGGGLDKALLEIEFRHLPAFEFEASENSMRVTLFGPKDFKKLSKAEKLRACFWHCVIQWIKKDYMSNSTLRDRFSLDSDDYQAVSAVIAEAIKKGRIVAADPEQGRRNAKYVPYWVN